MAITTEQIKALREATGAGPLDCKKALEQANGDAEKATVILREKGLAVAAKKAGRAASDGIIDSYIHAGSRMGVIIEVNCETDFVARTDAFKEFVHEVLLQIAAMKPEFVSPEDVPADVLEAEKAVYRAQAEKEGKPAPVVEKMVEGRVRKFLEEKVLLEQVWVKDDSKKVKDLLTAAIAKLGENIKIRRFARWEIGEGQNKNEAE
ncbi:MAG: translation elongation factor Ts [Chloroflexota bacterium]